MNRVQGRWWEVLCHFSPHITVRRQDNISSKIYGPINVFLGAYFNIHSICAYSCPKTRCLSSMLCNGYEMLWSKKKSQTLNACYFQLLSLLHSQVNLKK